MADNTSRQTKNISENNFDSILTEKFKYKISSWNTSDEIVMNKIDIEPREDEEEEEEEDKEEKYSSFF